MSDTMQPKFSGMIPDTKPFRMRSLTSEEKKKSTDTVNAILDNLDNIQGLLGLEEYAKQLSHWQSVLSAIEYEY